MLTNEAYGHIALCGECGYAHAVAQQHLLPAGGAFAARKPGSQAEAELRDRMRGGLG